MFGLDKKYIEFILKILNTNLPKAKFYVFGSRAKNTYQEYSDIDIAIDNNEKINADVISKTNSDFENSTLPYEVDIVDLNSINDTFKSAIKDTLKPLL